MAEENHSVRVTLQDVYQALVVQGKTLAKVEATLERMSERIDDTKSMLHDHEKRIRNLESRRTITAKEFNAALITVATVVGTLAAVISAVKFG